MVHFPMIPVRGMDSWDIIRTGLTNLLEVSRFYLHLWIKDDCPCLLILYNGSFGLSICHLFTGRRHTVAALIREEVPLYFLPRDLH